MDTHTTQFQDWESEGIIKSDYFSLDSHTKYPKTNLENSLQDSGESSNPNWIDPCYENAYPKKDSSEFWSDSSSEKFDAKSEEIEEVGGESGNEEKVGGEEGEKKSGVWWKLPVEILRCCVLRVNPVWGVSVAAAVIGLVILGRRLQKRKIKSRSLQLKVTMDDKKVSQFMTRAARLNEAFSVVKRVPLIRPSLPVAGVTPWPVLSLR